MTSTGFNEAALPAEASPIAGWLVARIARALGVLPEAIDLDARFNALGLDSAGALQVLAELSAAMGRKLSATLFWEHPTVRGLSAHLAAPDARGAAAGNVGRSTEALHGHPRGRAALDEPVAVVGLACRFPGARDPGSCWSLLAEGREAVREAPAGRGLEGCGGFLEQVDRFDAAFFSISPREAEQIDPQQRLMLELAWEALEDAGIPPDGLRGSATGVFYGAMWPDWLELQRGQGAEPTQHSATGQDLSIIPARVSYALGLRGPSLAVNTACSSSLVAVHLACQSLREGESTLALAGGVNLLLSQRSTVAMDRFGGLSPDGRCKAFDARANGYVRAEGGAVVVLKPLSRAIVDGDRIYCVVRGSAVNNDGYSNGLTAPSPQAQEAVLRTACARAGVPPEHVQYVEAHGTGTRLGDPIEAVALGRVYGAARPADRPLRIGSFKTNVGHLEAAAGIAGLVKVALALDRGEIPPSLHFRTPNPDIPFDALRLRVQTELTPWDEAGGPALAGISSFGFGGTNCHVVVQQWRSGPPEAGGVPVQALRAGAGGKLVFVLPGHGAQRAGMGRALLEREQVFREAVERCETLLAPRLGWSVMDVLMGAPGHAPLHHTGVIQPVVFSYQVALAMLWRSWGLLPDALVGHSFGEIAAAYLGGAFSLEDAARIIYERSRLMARFGGLGGMAVVGLPRSEAERLAARFERVGVGAENSPETTVLSGDPGALDEIVARLGREGTFARRVGIDVAAHSPQMDGLVGELTEALADLRPVRLALPLASTVRAELVDGRALDAAYWGRHLRQPVHFSGAIARLREAGYDTFVEVSAEPVLAGAVEQCLVAPGRGGRVFRDVRRGKEAAPPEAGSLVLPVSARTQEALAEAAAAMVDTLERRPGEARSICYTAARRRTHQEVRLAAVGASAPALAEVLRSFVRGEPAPGLATGRARRGSRLAFVFSGQGSQYAGMARRLAASEPVCRLALERCDDALAAVLGWSVLARLEDSGAEAALEDVELAQPALFALQVALTALWRHRGLEPDAVIGHSLGEISAAHAAGVLDLETAARVMAHRSRLLGRIRGLGTMAFVELSGVEAHALVAPHEGRVVVGAYNGPRATVLSGEAAALEKIRRDLEEQGVFCRPVRVDVASHSPQVEDLREELLAALAGLCPAEARVPFYSTVTGRRHEGSGLDAAYWYRNVREPVRYLDGLAALLGDGCRAFVELSPHPLLLHGVEVLSRERGEPVRAVPSLRRDEEPATTLLGAFGALYCDGYPVDWRRLDSGEARCVQLPPYPWQRERFWPGEEPVSAAGELHRVVWRRWSGGPEPARGEAGRWLVLADSTGVAAGLAERIAHEGGQCTLVTDPVALRRELAAPDREAWRGIVHLWALDFPADEGLEAGRVLAAQLPQCLGVVELVRRLAAAAGQPRIWLVTCGAQAASRRPLACGQAPLWGLGRVLAEEHPELWGGLVDLDPDAGPEVTREQLWQALCSRDADTEVAFRGGARWVPRLEPLGSLPAVGVPLRPDSAYLITGGLGAVGLAVARRLVEGGARHLILMGRSGLPSRGTWGGLDPESGPGARVAAVRRLEAAGASVHAPAVDVADSAALCRFLDGWRDELRPSIRGVVHAAGVIEDRLLSALDEAALLAVLRPKVAGSWNLHRAFAQSSLDFFVLCSSMGALIGWPGQGNYAAANAFLDALAHHRAAQGLPTLALDWGILEGLGVALTEGGQRLTEDARRQGIEPLDARRAMEGLFRLLGNDSRQVVALPADWARFVAARRDAPAARLCADRVEALPVPQREQGPLPITAVEQGVAEEVARVLKVAAHRLERDMPLGRYGLDSVLGMELRQRLERRFAVKLSATLAFNYPHIAGMAEHLATRLGLAPRGATEGQASVEPELLPALSEEEALAALLVTKREGRNG